MWDSLFIVSRGSMFFVPPDVFLRYYIFGLFYVPKEIFDEIRSHHETIRLEEEILHYHNISRSRIIKSITLWYFEVFAVFPLMVWAPAIGYSMTMFLLNLVSWLVVVLIWVLVIGGCISLAVIGSRKEARSKNPLKGILDVHGISK